MNLDAKIYVAGHRGLVGSAIVRNLEDKGYKNIIYRTHKELDLTNQEAVRRFFEEEKPEYVFLAAAKVGGIHANNTYPADFIYENLMIQNNVIKGKGYDGNFKHICDRKVGNRKPRHIIPKKTNDCVHPPHAPIYSKLLKSFSNSFSNSLLKS